MKSDSKIYEEIQEGQSLELLKELNLLTRTGQLNQDARRKLKQIYHFIQLASPFLNSIYEKVEEPIIYDMGSGKSYLGFLLYDLFVKKQSRGCIYGVELREDLTLKAQALAKRLQFERMKFQCSSIAELEEKLLPVPQLMIALHACDRATDEALTFSLKQKSPYIIVVPCCQAELSVQLKEIMSGAGLRAMWSHPLHARNFGSHLTNVIRCLVLESQGYKVRVTEFTSWEHTQKNEMILAEKIQDKNPKAQQQLMELLKSFPVHLSALTGFIEV